MNRIKELRKQKNLTLRQLSNSLKEKGLSLSTDSLSKYERGARNPKIENWVKLAKFFNVSIAYLKGENQKNCPMCGRDLRSDEKLHQTYRQEESNGEPADESLTGGN